MNIERFFICWALAGVVLTGCSAAGGLRTQLVAVLGEQAKAWNEGDVERFMQPYWQSPKLTFSSSGRVTRGWEATLAGYRERYPTPERMGRLTFSSLEVFGLGADAAMVLGRWQLEREAPVGGAFSLVFRRIGGAWVIVHDHTSTDDR